MELLVSNIDLNILSRTLISAMERFYSDPENIKKFEEWMQHKEEKHDTD